MKLDLRGIGRNKRRADEPRESVRPAEQAAGPAEQAAAPAEQAAAPAAPAGRAAPEAAPVQNTANTVSDAINQYSGKSEVELMGELVNFRKQGVIDDDKLAEVYQRLSPLLNEQQRKRLESVLGTLKNS